MTLKLSSVANILSNDTIENGVWIHLNDPVSGEPLYCGGDKSKPVRVLTISTLSRAFEAFIDELVRAGARTNRRVKNEEAKQELTLKRIKEEQPRSFAIVAKKLQWFDPETEFQEPGEDDKVALAKNPATKWIAEQVVGAANEPSNYGVEAEEGKDVAAVTVD